MNAPDIDRLLHYFDHGYLNPSEPTERIKAAMEPLFEVLAPLAPLKKNDEAKSIWLKIPRGDISDYESYDNLKAWGEVKSYEEYVALWKEDYPEEFCWYELIVAESYKDDCTLRYRAVAIGNKTIINASMNGEEPHGSYREDAAVELCELLTVAAEESIQKLFDGTYNDEVNASLPYEFRTGVLKRSVAFEKNPEYKSWVMEGMPESLLAKFKELLSSGANDEMKIGRLPQMTANDFYRACAIGYKACGYDGTDAPLVDQYFLHADGRDEGLSGRGDGLNRGAGIDFDDPEAWERWYFNREIHGGHPFEVCRGGNSTHVDLFVFHDQNNIDWKVQTGRIPKEEADHHERGFYFAVGGKHRAAEAVKFYMAITAAGLPVILSEADEILARFEATDYVGIVPHSVTPKYCESMFPAKYGHVIDFFHVDKEEMELYGDDIEWIPEDPAKLCSPESMKGKNPMQYTKEQNKELCDKYPFLIPTNRKSGKRITDGAGYWPEEPEKVPAWSYERTELDNMPYGWRKAFGEQLCEELKDELVKAGTLDNYRILQIKEKFGMLCWYDVGNTEHGREIIQKYEKQSARICIYCGEQATRVTTGWVRPTCDDCCPDMDVSLPLDEWLAKKQKELDDSNQSEIRMSEMA